MAYPSELLVMLPPVKVSTEEPLLLYTTGWKESPTPVIVPLFISAFRRANDLALAMEARCYHGGEGRTQMKPLIYQRRDHIAFIIVVVYLGAAIVLRIFGI